MLVGVWVAAWRSAILICLRMNERSPAVTTKPLPTGAGAAVAAGIDPMRAATTAPTAVMVRARGGRPNKRGLRVCRTRVLSFITAPWAPDLRFGNRQECR